MNDLKDKSKDNVPSERRLSNVLSHLQRKYLDDVVSNGVNKTECFSTSRRSASIKNEEKDKTITQTRKVKKRVRFTI